MDSELPTVSAHAVRITRPRPFPSPLDITPFVRKLYLVFIIHLIALFLIMATVREYLIPNIRDGDKNKKNENCRKQLNNTGFYYNVCWYGSLVLLVFMFVALYWGRERRRSWPLDVVCLSVFTVVLGLYLGMLDYVVIYLTVESVLVVALLILLMSLQHKVEVTSCLMYLLLLCWVLIAMCVQALCIEQPAGCPLACYFTYITSSWQLIGTVALSFLFAGYTLFNTQNIVMNRHYLVVKPDEYVFACLTFYTDAFDLLVYLPKLWK